MTCTVAVFVDIPCETFYPNPGKKHTRHRKSSFPSPRKLWLSLYRFSENSDLFKVITWIYSVLNLTHKYGRYVEIKCQLDATEVFIADLIACSTCFGHHYAHHQELKSIIQWLLQTGRITLSSTPDQLLEKPQQKIPHAATTV